MLYLALIGLPIVSACMWSGMLIGMLVAWFSDGHPKYSSMADNQHLAYISDIGAQRLKALFVTGCIVTTLLFNTAIASECHFRRKGSLGQGSGTHSKYTSILSQTFASCGALGLILLSIFDTANHETAHNVFLFIFILGYLASAICYCLIYLRLWRPRRQASDLRTSLAVKVTFTVLEALLVVAFASLMDTKRNAAAAIEWTIAFIFSFYILSFAYDFAPLATRKMPARNSAHIELSNSLSRSFLT